MTDNSPLSRAQIWTIMTAAWATGAVAAGFSFVGPVLTLLLERMTGSGAFIGTFATVGAITTVTLTPVAPKLMARFKISHINAAGCLVGALCFPLYYLFEDPVWWFGIRFIQGLFLTFVFVASETWINTITPEHLRGRVLSIYAIFLAGGLGLGAASAAILINIRGLEGLLPFLIGAAITAIGVLPLLARRHLPMEAPSAENSRLSTMWGIIKGSPGLMATGIAFGAIEYSLFHLLPVYGVRLGYSEGAAALLLLALPIGNILLQYPIGMLADKLPRAKVLLGLFALCVLVPGVTTILEQNYLGLMGAFGIFIGLATGLYTLGLSMLSEKHKGGRMASANSAFILMYGVGSLISPYVIGVSLDGIGPKGLPLVLGTISAFGLLAFALSERRASVDIIRRNGM
jgi:MFS family permease